MTPMVIISIVVRLQLYSALEMITGVTGIRLGISRICQDFTTSLQAHMCQPIYLTWFVPLATTQLLHYTAFLHSLDSASSALRSY